MTDVFSPFSKLTRQIGVMEHLAAKARLEAHHAPLPPTVHHPDGGMTIHWRTGTIDIEDYTHRDGHVVCVEGFDRYGWPKGHPDSPASLPA